MTFATLPSSFLSSAWSRLVARATPLLRRLVAPFRAWGAACSASAAVEFAIVLPVALGLYIGGGVISQGVTTARKVNLLTRTLADLLSHQSTSNQTTSTPTPPNALTAAQLSALLNAAQVLLTPQPTTTLQMTVSAVDLTNTSAGICCSAKVRWSYTQGGTLRPCNVALKSGTNGETNSPTTLPPALLPYNTVLPNPISILIADVNYTFQPVMQFSFGPFATFAPKFARNEFMFPRTSGQVVTGPLPAAGTQYGMVCY